jgi:release factor glutamine methyltransferase
MTSPALTWTLQALLLWCSKYFSDKALPTPRLDAELLLAFALKLRRLDLYLQFERPMTENELAAVKALIKRRAGGEPAAYIMGQKEFYSRAFAVTKDVLIPRPDTEILVDEVLKFVPDKMHGLEIGLGAGPIAITLLVEQPLLTMTAIDISEAALAVAKTNAEVHGVLDRLTLTHQDFLTDTATAKPLFDFLVSNPPYIKQSEMAELPMSVKAFEPHLALDGGADGLVFYRVIAERAKTLVKSGGFVAVEIGDDQGKSVSELFMQNGLNSVTVKKDLAGLDRVVVAQV